MMLLSRLGINKIVFVLLVDSWIGLCFILMVLFFFFFGIRGNINSYILVDSF